MFRMHKSVLLVSFSLVCFFIWRFSSLQPFRSASWGFTPQDLPGCNGSVIVKPQENRFTEKYIEYLIHRNSANNESYFGTVRNETKGLAACIVGGLRDFDLTGASIIRHVLNYYNPEVTFLNVPFDDNTHKLSVLSKSSSKIVINVIIQKPLPIEEVHKKVLAAYSSRNGIQGLLQYFQLVEGCVDLITEYERAHNVRFERILRTRVDSFWNADPPSLNEYSPDAFNVPIGSAFWGVNDRFAVANYTTGMIGLKRLSLLKDIYDAKGRGLTSERSLSAQLQLYNIKTNLMNIPFCVLSKHMYKWYMFKEAVVVISMSSLNYMNGAKCRPCTPVATGIAAEYIMKMLDSTIGGIGSINNIDICDATSYWEDGWKEIFNATVGQEYAKIYDDVLSRDYQTCVQENSAVFSKVFRYVGPPASLVCMVAKWEGFVNMGKRNEGWFVLKNSLRYDSIMYSFGTDRNVTWEYGLVRKHGLFARIFDCKPLGNAWVNVARSINATALFIMHDVCLGDRNGESILHLPSSLDGIHDDEPAEGGKEDFSATLFRGQFKRLDTIMSEYNHTIVDLMRVNIGDDFFRVCIEWGKKKENLPVCQLVADFGLYRLKNDDSRKECLRVLEQKGMRLVKCFGEFRREKCLFLSIHHCVFQ